jgi:glutamate carboxypeptidase
MEKTPETMALLQELLDACEKYDLGTLTAVESGGGSDSCYTQLAGVPSICSMGAVGAKQHTPEEYVEIKSIPLRAKILSAYFKG